MNDLEEFGTEVREERVAKRLSQAQLGKAIGYSQSYIAKVEHGTVLPSRKFATGCDLAFGAAGRFAWMWVKMDRRGHPAWFRPYIRLERTAKRIREYSPVYVPGILQTEEYARAVFEAALPTASEEVIQERIAARRQRQEILEGNDAAQLWVVLDEACLRRTVVSSDVIAGQLQHLLDMRKLRNVTIQVLPFSAGTQPTGHTYTLLSFADETTVVYEEALSGGRVVDSMEAVSQAQDIFDRLVADALSPRESARLITRVWRAHTMVRSVDLAQARWVRSSYSDGNGGTCVEAARGVPGVVPVRDSKVAHGPVLVFPEGAWAAFVGHIGR